MTQTPAQPPGNGNGRSPPPTGERRPAAAVRALRFVLLVGVMSFFADFTYEGSRSVVGPYLGMLGAGALAIAMVTGAGELLGYGLRLLSGPGADRSGRHWAAMCCRCQSCRCSRLPAAGRSQRC
ncbi:MAG: hypothetical protein ACRDNJ_01140 [Solirubrobacteraceae bacterium]